MKQLYKIVALYRQGHTTTPTGHVAEGGRVEDPDRTRKRGGPDDRGWRMDRGTWGGQQGMREDGRERGASDRECKADHRK